MGYLKKFKESAKQVPMPVWVAGVLLPGGLMAISVYLAWKASRKDKPQQSWKEFVADMIKESENENSKD